MDEITRGEKVCFILMVDIDEPDKLAARMVEDELTSFEGMVKDYILNSICDNFDGAVSAKVDLDESEKDILVQTVLMRSK